MIMNDAFFIPPYLRSRNLLNDSLLSLSEISVHPRVELLREVRNYWTVLLNKLPFWNSIKVNGRFS